MLQSGDTSALPCIFAAKNEIVSRLLSTNTDFSAVVSYLYPMAVGLATRFLIALLFLVRAFGVWAAFYGCSDSFVGPQFLEEFTLEAIKDPTHGRV